MKINIRAERFNRGLTSSEAAAQMGITRQTLERLELGGRPSARVAKRVADLYGCKPTDIWPIGEPEAVA